MESAENSSDEEDWKHHATGTGLGPPSDTPEFIMWFWILNRVRSSLYRGAFGTLSYRPLRVADKRDIPSGIAQYMDLSAVGTEYPVDLVNIPSWIRAPRRRHRKLFRGRGARVIVSLEARSISRAAVAAVEVIRILMHVGGFFFSVFSLFSVFLLFTLCCIKGDIRVAFIKESQLQQCRATKP